MAAWIGLVVGFEDGSLVDQRMEWIARVQVQGTAHRLQTEELIEEEVRQLRNRGVRLHRPRWIPQIKTRLVSLWFRE